MSLALSREDRVTGFILASASPRRVALLEQIGMQFIQRPAAIDESRRPGESAQDYVLRMASTKAETVNDLLHNESIDELSVLPPVLGADTTVVLADRIFGKPEGREEAIATLLALSGQRHQVLSAVAVTGISTSGTQGTQVLLSETWVNFRELNRAQCEQYWASGEPRDKAGAYAIQGRGAVFVESIQGSYSGVVGLPLVETVELLENYGVSYWNTFD
jgi:nucleoside triphosphate pyrophosphatase